MTQLMMVHDVDDDEIHAVDEKKSSSEDAMDFGNGGTGRIEDQQGNDIQQDPNSSVAPLDSVVNEWAQGTSIHGVPYITDAALWKLWKRSTWTCLVLISASFMVWQITELIRQFRDYDVVTDTQTINSASLDFPEVTVCNTNAYSKPKQEDTGIFEPVNEEELIQISHTLPQTLAFTWFNNKPLNTSEVWKPTVVNNVGLCWRFTTDTKIRRPGYFGGLKFWMDLRQNDYEDHTQYAGAWVWALQPGTEVSLSQHGTGAKSGQEAFVTLELTEHHRERTAPWARCKSQAPEYTQTGCRDECINVYLRKTCQCRMAQDKTDTSLRLCERRGLDFECTQEAIENEDLILDACDCNLPPCFEQEYDTNVIAMAASIKTVESLANAYGVSQEYVYNNFVAVTINYKKMQYKKLTESKGMTSSQLLGAIGGSMGFFLGISMVSLFELMGDLLGMRLLPRLFGHKGLYGLGAHYKQD